MNAEWEASLQWVTGLMVGLEFPDVKEMDEDLRFAMVLDLGIFRLIVLRWKLDESANS